jgi:hypothetical protein
MLNVKYLSALIGLMATIALFAVFRSNADQKPVEEGSCFYLRSLINAPKGALTLTWLEHGNVVNLKGAIPVVDQVDYRCVYQNLIDGQWIPIENPDKPLRQYVAYGQPLSKEQLETLAKKQAAPVPKME